MKRQNIGELIYLAVPYTHKDPRVMWERFRQVNIVVAKLMREGKNIFSPISHMHLIAESGDLPRDWEYWKGYDIAMISRCTKMIVLRLDGWKESTGVQAEIKLAERFDIPVKYMDFK